MLAKLKTSKMPRLPKESLKKVDFSKAQLISFIVIFGLVGGYFLTRSFASGATVSYEAENTTLSGPVAIGSDINASGGKYIQFGSSGASYYIDCTGGSDSNSGTSPSAAWQTITKANAATLSAGDSMLFKRGCTFSGSLVIKWSNVTISNYGTGNLPIFQSSTDNTNVVNVTGSGNTIDGLQANALPPATDSGCGNNPVGHIVGFNFPSGSTNNTLRNSVATGGYAGVYINSGASSNHIVSNQMLNNNMMKPLDTTANNDAGAFGVLLWGDSNEIAYNEIDGSDACSYDYTRDGSAVEIYNGSSNNIHNNKALNDDAFTELGKDSSHTSDGNSFAYNQFVSSVSNAIFLNTRGAGSSYGPVTNTKAYNNDVYVTGSSSQGVVCSSGCSSTILTLRNNILWAQWKALYADAAFNESNNIYWKAGGSPLVQGITIDSTSKEVDPLFVTVGSDFHLQSTSLAINSGTNESVSSGYTKDLDNHSVLSGTAVDIGAYEYGSLAMVHNTEFRALAKLSNYLQAAVRNTSLSVMNHVKNVRHLFANLTNLFKGSIHTPKAAAATDPVIAAVGDIHPDGGTTNPRAVKAAVDAFSPTAILGLGDYQYTTGTCANFIKTNNYDSDWGAENSKMYPTFGPTHDYDNTVGGSEAPTYMSGNCTGQVNPKSAGAIAAGGTLTWKTAYSFDIGTWHIVNLPSICYRYTSACDANAITTWLKNDLDAHASTACTIAYLHEPYWTSTTTSHGRTTALKPWIQQLYDHGVELLLQGHNHDYERFYPQNMSDVRDDSQGITAFVVGTGGIGFYSFTDTAANSANRQSSVYGALKLTLHPTSYDFQFMPVSGQTWTDSGTGTCHGAPGSGSDTSPPSIPSNLTVSAVGSSQVNLNWTASTDNVGVTGYKIFRGIGAIAPTQIATSSTNSYSDTTVSGGTSYTYYVVAYDAAGNNSGNSSNATITTSVSCSALPTDKGSGTITVNVGVAGTYHVWSRIMAPDTINNSYYIEVDANCPINVGDSTSIPASTWTWLDYQDGSATAHTSLALTAGNHTITMIGREAGVKLDRVILTTDTCIPTGTGDNCLSADTTPPTVSLTAPAAGATVSGSSVVVSAIASDAVGVAGVQFKLDGSNLGAEDTSSPYSLTWNTTTASNGTHSLTAVARDTSSNLATSSTVSVTVSNTAKPGDINGDGSVNITDLSILLTNWGTTTASCDLNGNGSVDIFDLSILLSNYGK